MKDISYSFRNIIATKKHTLNLEYQVADITMEHDEIWYNLDEKVANSIKLSDYNYYLSNNFGKPILRLIPWMLK